MISIVIPLYNKEKSILSTLESVLAQSYKDWECVVVDDGCTDKSREIVDQFKILDSRFQILGQPNSGVSAARNTGILVSKGEYVAFLDGDDLWNKDFLKELVQLIKDYPGKSIYGLGCLPIDGDDIPIVSEDTYFRGVSDWNWNAMAYSGSSTCVNKRDAIQVGLFDARMTHGEDIDMWWRLLLLHGGACYTRPYAFYRQDAENRAMKRIAPLEHFIAYYMDKYNDARRNNLKFRRFFDQEMVNKLYPYLFDARYRKEARLLASQLDYSQLKLSLRLRILFPHVYRLLSGK